MRKAIVLSAAVVVLGFLAVFASRWHIYRSEAYTVALSYVKNSSEVNGIIGSLESQRLSWLDDLSIEEMEVNGQKRGDAAFTLIASGSTGAATVRLNLIRDSNGWKVLSAKTGDRALEHALR